MLDDWERKISYMYLFMSPEEICESFGITDRAIDSYMDQFKPKSAINDHVCPGCKNDRCSKSERICWKCGGSL